MKKKSKKQLTQENDEDLLNEPMFCLDCGFELKKDSDVEYHKDVGHHIVLKSEVKPIDKKKVVKKIKGTINAHYVESIIVDDEPRFLSLNLLTDEVTIDKDFQTEDKIYKPLEESEYGYIPYKFTKIELERALKNKISKQKILEQIKKQIDKFIATRELDKHLILGDLMLSYEQDHISTVHYPFAVGETESGKSTIGQLFRWLAYRCLYGEDIPNADIYNFLGTDEEGAGTIVEDEAQDMIQNRDKIRTYKNSYSKGSVKPRIVTTQNSKKQVYYKTFCLKVFCGEMIPEDKGFKERLAIINMVEGFPQGNIKRLTDIEKKELLNLRNALLIYKVQNHKLGLPKIKTKLTQRDQELWEDFLTVVYGTKYFEKCDEAVAYYVNQRHESIWNSLEARLFKIIRNLVNQDLELTLEAYWTYLISDESDEVAGRLEKETYYPYDFAIKVTRNYLASLFEGKFYAKKIQKYRPDKEGKKHKITYYQFKSDVISALTRKYNIENGESSNNGRIVSSGGSGGSGQLSLDKADHVDHVDHLNQPQNTKSEYFFCHTCNTGWHDVKYVSHLMGNLLKYHQDRGCEIEFRERPY